MEGKKIYFYLGLSLLIGSTHKVQTISIKATTPFLIIIFKIRMKKK
jgi:hypothetical protein